MNLFYNSTKISPADTVLSHYAADEFASPTRSTVPLLSWLKHEQLMVSALLHCTTWQCQTTANCFLPTPEMMYTESR